jgi:3-hydroxyisobutyrate dehydrogenase
VNVAFLGIGTMGAAMAANIARAGFPVTVWNRSPARAQAIVGDGVTAASSPAKAAATAQVTVVCVSDTPDVEAVLFGPSGAAEGAAAGSIVVDMSTISPSATRQFAERLATRDVTLLDAPVSGGSEGARKGTLSIFVGGDEAALERARPILAAMGTTITHCGPSGAGQVAKAVNQVILAGTYLGVAEGLVLAMKSGLDPALAATALSGGAAQSWVLANRSRQMIENDYPLGFRTALHLKDLRIALGLAEELGADLPVTGLAATFEEELLAGGHGDEDVSNLARIIRSRSGLAG